MAQYVIHQIGFWYTDECFAVGEERGTVMGITRSMEEAQAIKKREDIESMKRTAGINPGDFYFDSPNTDEIIKQLTAYYKAEFDLNYDYNNSFCSIPDQLTDEQAARFLSILELSFHNIVEYGENEVIDPTAFGFDQYEGDISGF